MATGTIICVLSSFRPLAQNGAYPPLGELERVYRFEDEATEYKGAQANEASVRFLLREAHDSGCAELRVAYLCSPDCTHELTVPKSFLSRPGEADADIALVTTEDYFKDRVTEYCAREGVPIPTFSPIRYSPDDTAGSFASFARTIRGSRVSVDMTGGSRGITTFMVLAIDALKRRRLDVSDGLVVCGGDDGTIRRQDDVLKPIELIGALNAFIGHGDSQPLLDYFSTAKSPLASNTKRLFVEIAAFSEALALCRADEIEKRVARIKDLLVSAKADLQGRNVLELSSQAFERLGRYDARQLDGLQEVARLFEDQGEDSPHGPGDLATARSGLEEGATEVPMGRLELRLYEMLDTFRDQLPFGGETPGLSMVNVMLWCADHHMMQQALCLFREKITLRFEELHYILPTERYEALDEKARKTAIANACACMFMKPEGVVRNRRYFEQADGGYFEPDSAKSEQLRAPLCWYEYLRGIRNQVVHVRASEERDTRFRIACEVLGKDPLTAPRLEELKGDIHRAIAEIELPPDVDDEVWRNAVSQVRDGGGSRG